MDNKDESKVTDKGASQVPRSVQGGSTRRFYHACMAVTLLSVLTTVTVAAKTVAASQTDDSVKISKKLTKTPLNVIARDTLQNYFAEHPKTLKEMVKSYDLTPDYKQAKGLFVTLYKDGKTRACWGSITPNHGDLVSNTVFTTIDCMTREYRFGKIQKKELNDLKAQVTIIEAIEPVSRGTTLHPLTDGLMVRAGGKGAVLLPGEASDPHYQVMQCKLKAGINPNEPCQIYRIEAHVIR